MPAYHAQRHQTKAGDQRSALARLASIGWFNGIMLGIGASAAIGYLIAIAGSYLPNDSNLWVILTGAIITMLASIAWLVISLSYIGGRVIDRFFSPR